MPRSSWLGGGSSSTHLSGLASNPPSRPGSPTGHSTPSLLRSSHPSSISIPSTPFGNDIHDTPGFGASGSSSQPGSYFSQGLASGATTPFIDGSSHHGNSHLEIILDHESVILRGAGGDTNPGSLSGRVVLHLSESTSIREISLTLTGKGKVQFNEGHGNHHYTHLLLHHDWNFLQTANSKKHYQTLKAGAHSFPFQYTIESDTAIPSSIKTFSNDAAVNYKLRAVAYRSAFASNFLATKPVTILRTFTNEALEYTQTLEIENTWPGKVSYCITLPHKAFAAGDEIPMAIKFQPLAKGVFVTSITTVLKEYTLVHTKNSSHPEVRVAAQIKHDLVNGRAIIHKDGLAVGLPPAQTHSEDHSPAATPSLSRGGSHMNLPTSNGSHGGSGSAAPTGVGQGGEDGYFPLQPVPSAALPAGSSVTGEGLADAQEEYQRVREIAREVELGDGEVDTMITLPVPVWTTPTHGIHPVFVTHKIKWSCVISNPDGHTSELRCALPIHILAAPLAAEAFAASSGTRALLFGGQTAENQVTTLDLPSYSNHVYDRVANASVPSTISTMAAAWTRNSSPSNTPPGSRPPSRPGSPTGLGRTFSALSMGGSHPTGAASAPSSFADDNSIPERPHLTWADSELLLSLGANLGGSGANSNSSSPHATPPESRAGSRPSSRSGRRSRPGSRNSSPERGASSSSNLDASSHSSGSNGVIHAPVAERRGSGAFHLPKSKMAFTPFSRTPSKHPQTPGSGNPLHPDPSFPSSGGSLIYPNHQPLIATSSSQNLAHSHSHQGYQHHHHGGGSHSSSANNSNAPSRIASTDDVTVLSQVPSYQIAASGFLGGGVPPISAYQGLPSYDASETYVRTQSQMHLADMAAEANKHNNTNGDGNHSSPISIPSGDGAHHPSHSHHSSASNSFQPSLENEIECDEEDEDEDAFVLKSRSKRSQSNATIVSPMGSAGITSLK